MNLDSFYTGGVCYFEVTQHSNLENVGSEVEKQLCNTEWANAHN